MRSYFPGVTVESDDAETQLARQTDFGSGWLGGSDLRRGKQERPAGDSGHLSHCRRMKMRKGLRGFIQLKLTYSFPPGGFHLTGGFK